MSTSVGNEGLHRPTPLGFIGDKSALLAPARTHAQQTIRGALSGVGWGAVGRMNKLSHANAYLYCHAMRRTLWHFPGWTSREVHGTCAILSEYG